MLKITKNQGSIQVTADKSGFYPFDGTITFPTNSLFTATSANTDMITFKSTSNGDVQFVGNYKDITISGRSYDTKQKFLTAFSNLANQGSVDAYTKAETDAKLNDKLTAQTNAKDSLFISSPSNDDAGYSVALYSSSVNGNGDVAIGLARTLDKKGYLNLAILNEAEANGIQNIAIGDNRRCDGTKNVGIGAGEPNTVDVNGQGNVCIGASSQAHTDNNNAVNKSIAIGTDAKAGNNYCTVIGPSATSYGNSAVAIGESAYVGSTSGNSVAVGSYANGNGKNSVAIGYLSSATNEKPLEICCGKDADNRPLRVLQSDANGKISLLKGDGTDERIVIQDEIEALKNAGGGGTVDAYTKAETDTKLDAKQDKLTAGNGITITKDETAGTSTIATAVSLTDNGNGAYQVGDSIEIGGRLSVRIGNNTSTLQGQNSIAIGDNAVVNNKNSISIGVQAITSNENCIAIGNNTNTTYYTTNCVVIGNHAQAASSYCTVIGPSSKSNTSYAVAVGYNIYIDSKGRNSVAVGSDTKAYGKNSVAIGYSSQTTDDKPLVINAGYKTVDGVSKPLTVMQSDSTGKLSVLKGDGTDERMVIQDEIAALKAEIAALKGGASTGDTTGA